MITSTFVASDGARLAFRFDGPEDGPVLVLSNSLGTAMAMWRPQMTLLSRQFRVLRYDSRGHGRSSAPSGDYSMARLGQDVVELMDHTGVVQASFCGLSMGGMAGQWLGAHASERIRRLVLCNTSPYMGPEGWRARIEAVREGGLEVIVDPVLARWFTPEFSIRRPAAVSRMRTLLLSQKSEGYIGCCAAIRDMDLRGSAPDIGAPTLVIGGTADQATPPADSEWLAKTIPGASLAMLPAAHLSNIECSRAFTRLVRVFLS
jgi:3-oxoadipate enol-lactonase